MSIIEATRDEALRFNMHKVGLIGTIFTMTDDFFKKTFVDSHIEIMTPTIKWNISFVRSLQNES